MTKLGRRDRPDVAPERDAAESIDDVATGKFAFAAHWGTCKGCGKVGWVRVGAELCTDSDDVGPGCMFV